MPHKISADGAIKPHFLAGDAKTLLAEENLRAAAPTTPPECRLVRGRVRLTATPLLHHQPPVRASWDVLRSHSDTTLLAPLKPLVGTLRGAIDGHNRHLYATTLEWSTSELLAEKPAAAN